MMDEVHNQPYFKKLSNNLKIFEKLFYEMYQLAKLNDFCLTT